MDSNFLIKQASLVYGCNPLEKISKRNHVFSRAAIAVQLRDSGITFQEIGEILNRDHTTIMFGVQKHVDNMKFDKNYRSLYNEFLKNINKPINKEEFTILDCSEKAAVINKQLLDLGYKFEDIEAFWNDCISIARQEKLLTNHLI